MDDTSSIFSGAGGTLSLPSQWGDSDLEEFLDVSEIPEFRQSRIRSAPPLETVAPDESPPPLPSATKPTERRGWRAWAITWNNPQSKVPGRDPVQVFRQLPGAKRLLAEWEVGKETHTPHLQALVIFESTVRWTAVTAMLPGAWASPLKKKLDVLRWEKYCKKDNTVVVDVDRRYSRDVKEAIVTAGVAAYQAALEGDPAPLVESAGPKWTFLHLRKIREALAYGPQLVSRTSRTPPFVVWLWGKSGAGKTHFVRSVIARLGTTRRTFFLSNAEPRAKTWWDGMSALTQTVVCDDLRDTTMSFGFFCQAISSLPVKVDAKNATVDFCASLVLITTPAPPWSFWPQLEGQGDVDQVLRRVGWCVEFLGAPSPPIISSAAPSCATFVTPPPASAAAAPSENMNSVVRYVTPAWDPSGADWNDRRKRAMLRAVIRAYVHVHWADDPADAEVGAALKEVLAEECVTSA